MILAVSIASAVIQLLAPIIVYATALILTSIYYIEYLRGGSSRVMKLIKVALILISLFFFGYVFLVVYNIINNTILVPLALVLTIIALVSLRRPKCGREEEAKVDGMKYVVCYTDVINAWYNPKTRKFYVSNVLKELLSDNELKAVLYHEEGHARNMWLTVLSSLISIYWILAISSILLLLVVLWKANVALLQLVSSIMLLLFLASTLTLTAMVISWVAEHESDKRALESVGFESISLALVKLHVYGALGRFLNLVKKIELKGLNEIISKNTSIVTLRTLLLILLIYSWRFPMWIHELAKTPMYYTHPPLELRLALLAYYSKNKD